jgi:hypothetical protein
LLHFQLQKLVSAQNEFIFQARALARLIEYFTIHQTLFVTEAENYAVIDYTLILK